MPSPARRCPSSSSSRASPARPTARSSWTRPSGLWPEGQGPAIDGTDLSILIPSFLVTELTRAFQIGFLLYLPVIVIDLVVTTVLMAMGMSMVSPTIISTPLKLFLFVAVEGWTRLVHGLVLSYAV